MELLKNHDVNYQNHEQITNEKLVDKDFVLISRLTQTLKILGSVLMYENLSSHLKFEIENAYYILDTILKDQNKDLKPTTNRLKNLINQALIKNQHGDGVIVRVLKHKASKIEKCSLLNFYIDEN